MSDAKHNVYDYLRFLKGQRNRMWMKASYGRQVTDAGVRQMFRMPLIRFRNGHVHFGSGVILRGLVTVVFGGAGDGSLILGDDFIGDGDLRLSPRGGSIALGKRTFVGQGSLLQAYDGTSIRVGDDVMIANHVTMVASSHGMAAGARLNEQPESGVGIVIEEDVWVGAHAVILDGAYLERGCVVAAGAVVRGRVEANVIVAGVPARTIGLRGRTV